MKKKLIILDHKGGRLGNQLWNYISVYAYCLEAGYACHNYSFYKYDTYFDIPEKTFIYRIFLLFHTLTRVVKKNRFAHQLYRTFVRYIEHRNRNRIIDSGIDPLTEGVFYLSPTPNQRPEQKNALEKALREASSPIYLEGWLFRNPVGIEKYREEIKRYFAPKRHIRHTAEHLIASLRKQYQHIVGVHIRQGDYKGDIAGANSPVAKVYFDEHQVSHQLREYISHTRRDLRTICFVICSDDPVNLEPFSGLNVVLGPGGILEDLYTLSLTDLIMGSNSSFGAFASYYGNIPFIVFDRQEIDWEYYKGKHSYFENKYCKVVFF